VRARRAARAGVQLAENVSKLRVHLLEELGMFGYRQPWQPAEHLQRGVHARLAGGRKAARLLLGFGQPSLRRPSLSQHSLGSHDLSRLSLVLHLPHHFLVAFTCTLPSGSVSPAHPQALSAPRS
jgi:hypothetical protein